MNEHPRRDLSTGLTLILAGVAIAWGVVYLVAISIRNNEIDPSESATVGYRECAEKVSDQLGRQSIQALAEVCDAPVSWYVEQPLMSAAAAAIVAFLLGGVALLLVRAERR